MKKCAGNIGDILTTGICILAMTAVMVSYMDSVALIQQKTQVGQIARKFILRMETIGYLTDADRTIMTAELEQAGVTEISYAGTTMSEVGYGEPITLKITGKLKEEYVFEEQRASTAKN